MARNEDLVAIIAQLRRDVAELQRLGASRWSAPSAAGPWGLVGYAMPTAAGQTGITTVTDLTGLSVTATAVAGRLWRITFFVVVQQVSSTGVHNITLADGSNTALAQPGASVGSGSFMTTGGSIIVTPSAGSNTYKLRAQTSAGTLSINQSSTAPNAIIIEDVGPA